MTVIYFTPCLMFRLKNWQVVQKPLSFTWSTIIVPAPMAIQVTRGETAVGPMAAMIAAEVMPAVVMEPTAVIMITPMSQGISTAMTVPLAMTPPRASFRSWICGAALMMELNAPPMPVISRGSREAATPRATHLLRMMWRMEQSSSWWISRLAFRMFFL